MAVGKWKLYDTAKQYLADGTFDLDDNTNWKIALFQQTSNCNTLGGTNDVFGDLTNEASGGNYPAGGVAVTPTWGQTSGTATFDTDNAQFAASGGSIVCRYAVIYKNATVNSIVKPLLAVCLLDTTPADTTVTDGNTLTIGVPSGIFTLSGATTDA